MAGEQRVHFGGGQDPVASILMPLWLYYRYMLPGSGGYEYAPSVIIAAVHLLQPELEELEDRHEEVIRDYEKRVKQAYENGIDACWIPDSND